MSLVLDTNANGWWYEFANIMLDHPWYPDFNQILLKPAFPIETTNYKWIEVQSGDNIPSRYNVLSVNWTVINFWASELVAPICFQWNWWWWWYWNQSKIHCPNGWWTSWTYRVWLKNQLSWWEIIWKLIRWAVHYSTHTTTNKTRHATIRVWLLHSDWTITYCGSTIDAPSLTTWTAWWYMVYYSQTNTWIVAQAGDYVIADVWITSTVYGALVWFWMDWWPNPEETYSWMDWSPFPIEISIE